MTIGRPRRGLDGGVIGIQFAVLDILANGAVKEKRFLTDNGDVMAQRSQ